VSEAAPPRPARPPGGEEEAAGGATTRSTAERRGSHEPPGDSALPGASRLLLAGQSSVVVPVHGLAENRFYYYDQPINMGRAFAGRVCACVRAAEVKHNRAELMAAKLGLSGGSDDEEVEGLLPSPPLSVPPLGGVGPLRGSGGDGDDGWVLSAAEREGSAVGGDGLSRGWAAERLKGRGRGKGAVRDRPA
jgi:hypothetical protein